MRSAFFRIALTLLVSAPCSAWSEANSTPRIRNIILVIGDGMGPQQLSLALLYARQAAVPRQVLNLERMLKEGTLGVVLTNSYGSLVADSACAGTQLATGEQCRSETIGITYEGKEAQTIAELASAQGMATGLVTDTRITHATPAVFAAHVSHRREENEIAVQLSHSSIDVLLGGGLRHWLPREVNDTESEAYRAAAAAAGQGVKIGSKRNDSRNVLQEAEERGYRTVFTREQLLNDVKEAAPAKLLGLFTSSGMPDGIEHTRTKADPGRTVPTLLEMSQEAIGVLSKDPEGFFLMIEAGQIDWAAHANDAGTLLHEMLRLDEVLGYVRDWSKDRSDTLVLLIADHETGSFGLSYSSYGIPTEPAIGDNHASDPKYNFLKPEVLNRIYRQKKSYQSILHEFSALPKEQQSPETLMGLVNDALEFDIDLNQAREILADEPNEYFIAGHETLGEQTVPRLHDFSAFYPESDERRQALIARAIAAKQGVVWGTGTHTATPVLVVAQGPKWVASKFSGLWQLYEIGRLLQDFVKKG